MPPEQQVASQSRLQRATGHCGGSRGDTRRSAYLCQSCRRRPGGGWASMCTPRRPNTPGSSCSGARRARARESLPRLGLLLASSKLPCAPPPEGLLQPELVHPTVRGNSDLGLAALREPKRTGWGVARLPRRWRTTLRVGVLSGSSWSWSWGRSWRSRLRARRLSALRRSGEPENYSAVP